MSPRSVPLRLCRSTTPAAVATLWLLLTATLAAAAPEPFRFRPLPPTLSLEAGKPGELKVEMAVDPGHYLYDDMLAFKVSAPRGISTKPAILPKGHEKYDIATETNRMVHDGTGVVRLPLTVTAEAPAQGTLGLVVDFQGCNPTSCFMPTSLKLKVPFTVRGGAVAPNGGTTAGATTESAEPLPPLPATATPVSAEPAPVSATAGPVPPEPAPKAAASPEKTNYGSVLVVFVLFFYGILTSLTPCVLPLVPITIAIFGAKKAKTKIQSFLLSLTYVQGICLVYSVLGMAAALSGSVFGQHMSKPGVVSGIALFFTLMGLYMAGVFHFNLPSSWQTRASRVGGKGYLGAFAMGMASGVIAAPCSGPVLAGVLAWVSSTRQVLLGFLLLYFYALGIGMLSLVLGTFSSLISRMPKSGDWMEVVKSFFAVTMFAVALFYLKDLLPVLQVGAVSRVTLFNVGIWLILVGFLSKGLKVDFHQTSMAGVLRKVAALLLVTAGAHAVVIGIVRLGDPPAAGDASAPGKSAITWRRDLDSALAEGARTGKPVVVDFGATWCAACKELEHYTFSDARVEKELGRFIAVKVDMSESNPANDRLKEKYGIVGLPLVVFYDRTGKLLATPRVMEFIPAEGFLERLRQVP